MLPIFRKRILNESVVFGFNIFQNLSYYQIWLIVELENVVFFLMKALFVSVLHVLT